MTPFENLQHWKVFGSLLAVPKSQGLSEKTAYSQLAGSASDTESLLESGSESTESVGSQASTTSWRFKFVTIVGFALLNLAFLVSWRFAPTNCRPLDASDRIFPRYEYEEVIFHDDHIVPSPESNKIWNDELPHGNGFTIIDDPDSYRLPPGQAYGARFNKYGVSWAHQYHCVWMLRDAFFDLVNNKSALTNVDINEKSAEGAELWHLAHCFGYLRQHIICNMDMTLEWPTLKGPNAGIINGYEIPHQCKKREALDVYMDEHAPDPALLVPQKMKTWPSHQDIIDGLTT